MSSIEILFCIGHVYKYTKQDNLVSMTHASGFNYILPKETAILKNECYFLKTQAPTNARHVFRSVEIYIWAKH